MTPHRRPSDRAASDRVRALLGSASLDVPAAGARGRALVRLGLDPRPTLAWRGLTGVVLAMALALVAVRGSTAGVAGREVRPECSADIEAPACRRGEPWTPSGGSSSGASLEASSGTASRGGG